MKLSEHFELAEFLVSETAAHRGIANEPTMDAIENLRRLCQLVLEPLRIKLGRPVVITSGYRSSALNRAVSDIHEVQSLLTEACRNVLIDIGQAIERQKSTLIKE